MNSNTPVIAIGVQLTSLENLLDEKFQAQAEKLVMIHHAGPDMLNLLVAIVRAKERGNFQTAEVFIDAAGTYLNGKGFI